MSKVSQAEYRERLNRIIRRIKRNPKCHDQRFFHCGTSHCIAGHAQLDAKNINVRKVFKYFSDEVGGLVETAWADGRKYLGLSHAQASWLFMSNRTLEEIVAFSKREKFSEIPELF